MLENMLTAAVSELIERSRRIDRANYTNFVVAKEIRRRIGKNYSIPDFAERCQLFLRAQQIENYLIENFSNLGDVSLAKASISYN